MECIYFRCETCGFTHQVPSYWSDYDQKDEIEMLHINLQTKESCDDLILKRVAV